MKKITLLLLLINFILLNQNAVFGEMPKLTQKDMHEYMMDRKCIEYTNIFLSKASNIKKRNLETYKKFADKMEEKWCDKNREAYAYIMLRITRPLTSGLFKDKNQYELARKYALSVLEKPDEISLDMEFGLRGCVTTTIIGPEAPKDEEFAKRRKIDIAIRLHVWKRMLDMFDPDWDPNEVIYLYAEPPEETGLPVGVDPKGMKNSDLRMEYEAAIKLHGQKVKKFNEQYTLRDRLKYFPKGAEKCIVRLYSHPPFDIKELKEMLNIYLPDNEANIRILNAVEKNTGENY